MAERSNATSKKNQEAAQDVGALQKRGRRRLLGAIALVLLAVIVLPMVFDPEPKPIAPAVSIRIPSEEGTKFIPKVAPKPAPPQPEPVSAETKVGEPAPAPKTEAKIAAQVPERPAVKAPESRTLEKQAPPPPLRTEKKTAASAPAAAGEQFIVQVGAFASPEKVRQTIDKLKESKLPYYTEAVATAKGSVTRVRMGPFASKDAAEKARAQVKALDLNPANPILK